MQLIAESYDLLRRVGGHDPDAIADVFAEWNKGELESYLIEITAEVLRQRRRRDRRAARRRHPRPGRVEGHRRLDGAERGRPRRPGRRHRRGGVRPRASSSKPEQREAVRGTVERAPRARGRPATRFEDDVRAGALRVEDRRLRAGLRRDHRRRRRSTTGTSTRARSPRSGAAAASSAPSSSTASSTPTRRDPDLATLLEDAVLRRRHRRRRGGLAPRRRRSPRCPASPCPGSRSALAYYDSLRVRAPARRARSRASATSSAHTYRRVDKPGTFHTLWSGDRSEVRTDG